MSPQLINYVELREWMRVQAKQLGFSDLRVADLDMQQAEPRLKEWLEKGHHGDMNYMVRHANLRADPQSLHPGAIRALCLRMDYVPKDHFQETSLNLELSNDWRANQLEKLQDSEHAVVALYARGRDYHKVLRTKLQELSDLITQKIGEFGHRVFVDSAPVMEVELAQKSGLSWRGKHTLGLNREGGSFFFLGEIFVDIPLPVDEPITSHCGECQACIQLCPTQAIIAPYQVDARRCISYLTIEHHGSIPEEFRTLIGNRIYGCDDCQLVCPWNKFAQSSVIGDFSERNNLGHSTLLQLWLWSEEQFLNQLQGSPIRRIGYERWTRNLAVGLGNALRSPTVDLDLKAEIRLALLQRKENTTPMVVEHIDWALESA